jgi:preprotein translocase subunit SecG
MFLMASFLILLVLVQRGRGGGLSGAFGGLGGQSAFGAKAGDLFTRITMISATIWILLCIAAIKVLNSPSSSKFKSDVPSAGASFEAPSTEEGGRDTSPGESDESR